MALLNPSFEDAGALPGEAAHWTLIAVTQLSTIAGFGGAPELAWETFDWGPWFGSLADVPVTRMFFGANGFENFEVGWLAGVYVNAFSPAQLVAASFGGMGHEDFETGWLSTPYLRTWAEVSATAALFDGEPLEDFEEGWRGNETYPEKWVELISTPALFDGGASTVEDFENGWSPATTL